MKPKKEQKRTLEDRARMIRCARKVRKCLLDLGEIEGLDQEPAFRTAMTTIENALRFVDRRRGT